MTSALALALLLAGASPAEGIPWGRDFDKAMKEARRHGKPVVVDFWAEWCGWCHRLDRTTYADPVVAEQAKAFVPVKVNTEGSRREIEIAEHYRVNNLPTILFLSPSGRQVWRVNSFQGPGRFPETLAKAFHSARQVISWEEAIERNPQDAFALLALGQHLFEQESYEESRDLLTLAIRHDQGQPASDRRRARLLLAILQNVEGRYEEAESLIKEALSLEPKGEDQPKLLFILGRTYVSWGRRAEGKQTMEVIVREYPQSPIAEKARETLFVLERKQASPRR